MNNNFFKNFDYILYHKYKILLIPIITTIILVFIISILEQDFNKDPNKSNFSYEVEFIEKDENFIKIDLINLILNLSSFNDLSMNYLSLDQSSEILFPEGKILINKNKREINSIDLKKSFLNKLKFNLYVKNKNQEINYPYKIIVENETNLNNDMFKVKFLFSNSEILQAEKKLSNLLEDTLKAVNLDWKTILSKEIEKYIWQFEKFNEYFNLSINLFSEKARNSIQAKKEFENLNNEVIRNKIDQIYDNQNNIIDVVSYTPLFLDLQLIGGNDSISKSRFALAIYIFVQIFIVLLFIFLFEYKRYKSA